MKISEIKPNTGKINLKGKITKKFPEKEFATGKVCNCILTDEDNNEITLVLWNEQIEQVKEGDEVQITNGYAKEWNGKLQLSTGKFGKLDVLSSNKTLTEINKEDSTKQEQPEKDKLIEEIDKPQQKTTTQEEQQIKENKREITETYQQEKKDEQTNELKETTEPKSIETPEEIEKEEEIDEEIEDLIIEEDIL